MLTGWNAKHTLAAIAMLLVFGLVLVFALNRGGDDDTPEATATPTPSATTVTATTPTESEPAEDPFVVAPGRVGAAKVGMSKAQAAATGQFNVDVDHGPDDCRGVSPLEWKPSFGTGLDVFVDDSDKIASMGISESSPKTAEGIGVGSTLSQVKAAYEDLTLVEEAGFDQSGNYVVVGDRYLGFLYNENAFDATNSSKVIFMEVTKGDKPELIRDGC
ncbi:hypothetical protein J2X11_001967 [Aeromicrobium panaciterrae]|uniref:Uncharacterized protein n=1 Tax=Aeromicrobium panaciterrae TaxID=363861 RepID=A0ABU1UPL8_9ACTN|nr:hypothetical protein [Aeromicrobium panaciterrae]MDR7087128.1 hypothetical protein [Aeromicrobium panaciterrae]